MQGPAFSLYLITDGVVSRNPPLAEVLGAALSRVATGEAAVQLREKHLPPMELFNLAVEMREIAHRSGAMLFVNDRADVALAAGADGVHLTGGSLPVPAVRGAFPQLVIGASVHSEAEAERAFRGGADFVVAGPVFRTPSKPWLENPMGVEAFGRLCKKAGGPVYAIGGVGPENASRVVDAGARGVACISAVMGAADPAAAASEIVKTVQRARVASTGMAGLK